MFSIKEAIVFGWKTLRKHSGLMLGVVLTLFALQVMTDIVERTLQGTATGFAASIMLGIVGVVLGCGATLISLKLAKGEAAQYRDIVPDIKTVWRYFCSSFLSGLIAALPLMAGGFVAFIILAATGSISFSEGPWQGSPAAVAVAVVIMAVALAATIYLALRYSMARMAVLEEGEIIGSIRRSTTLTRDRIGHLFLFVLALIGINILGLLVLVVGLLVSVPVSMLAFAHVYLKLKARG